MKSVVVTTQEGVTSLDFGYFFNWPVEGLDLKGVTSLEFGDLFNQPIEGLDLKRVKYLHFGYGFNQSIERFDLKEVEVLHFGVSFNQPVEGLDLKGVKSLTFGDYFNQKVERLDLKGVETLIFGLDFNQPIDGLDLADVHIVLPANHPYKRWHQYHSLETYKSTDAIYNTGCLICCDQDKQPVILECKHLYCYSCLKRWYRHSEVCCYCREPFNINRVFRVKL